MRVDGYAFLVILVAATSEEFGVLPKHWEVPGSESKGSHVERNDEERSFSLRAKFVLSEDFLPDQATCKVHC